jgi:hypothetical protein
MKLMKQTTRPDGFDFAAVFALVAAALFAGYLVVGCTPAKSAAELDYTAKQLACVDRYPTKDEAVACRNKVKAEWAAKQQSSGVDTKVGGQ